MNATTHPILIGTNARLFPSNWRPAADEIEFAAANGFDAIQFQGQTEGLGELQLGASIAATAALLKAANLAPVMEILIFVNEQGIHETGYTPVDILEANLPAIDGLACTCVHWHIALRPGSDRSQVDLLEAALVPMFARGLEIAKQHGFRFAVEHNAAEARPFHTPERVNRLLNAVPGLGLVWDLNHTAHDDLAAYLALAPQMTMLHVADTPLPEVNYHLPLGLGNLDFHGYMAELLRRGFRGPAILEIGGLPKSGGYGRDTDEALIDSRQRLAVAIATANT